MTKICNKSLTDQNLGDGLYYSTGFAPDNLLLDQDRFEACWSLRPSERHTVMMYGKLTPIPRHQQAYEKDYSYTGSRNNALPLPALLRPLLDYAKRSICGELNGLLLNWYAGQDYIGEHHDSTKGLVHGSPIVTFSFGETRTFRLTCGKGKQRQTVDFPATDGSIIVIPWDTNKAWKHAVPRRARYDGRRISVTMRAFVSAL